jgi:hypothetical protein
VPRFSCDEDDDAMSFEEAALAVRRAVEPDALHRSGRCQYRRSGPSGVPAGALGLAGGDGSLFSSRRDLGRHDLAATGVIRDHPSNNAGGPHPWLEGSTRAAPFRVVAAKLVPSKTSSTTC